MNIDRERLALEQRLTTSWSETATQAQHLTTQFQTMQRSLGRKVSLISQLQEHQNSLEVSVNALQKNIASSEVTLSRIIPEVQTSVLSLQSESQTMQNKIDVTTRTLFEKYATVENKTKEDHASTLTELTKIREEFEKTSSATKSPLLAKHNYL